MSNLDLIAAAGNSIATATGPEGVSFDGTNDYLSRSSDLTGNADGKTFTFSCWVYASAAGYILRVNDTVEGLWVSVSGTGAFNIRGHNASSTMIFNAYGHSIPLHTWSHILASIDLTNSANRYIYINDIDETSSFTFNAYTNDNIDFTGTAHYVGCENSSSNLLDGRLSNVFLDYQYRDLSIEANRRLFIDADGKPVDTSSLNGIIDLPMTDAATAGDNRGTGGNFTINGVLDTAQRGANQWNCVASEFDGTADYMKSTSGYSGDAASTTCTVAFNLKIDSTQASNHYIFSAHNGTGHNNIQWNYTYEWVSIQLGDRAAGKAVEVRVPVTQEERGKNLHIVLSVNMATVWPYDAGRKVSINGVVQADTDVTWQTWNKDWSIRLGNASNLYVGIYDETYYEYWHGVIGEFWRNDQFYDLSTSNPFWDADNNIPKPVAQVIEETGTTPLIALPIRGDDAGNNLGTGGDFTVYSGPFTGARGGSEFWARSAKFDGSTGYLSRTALTGLSTGTKATFAFAVPDFNETDYNYYMTVGDQDSTAYVTISNGGGAGSFNIKAGNGGTDYLDATLSGATTGNLIVLVSIDTAASALDVVINGTYTDSSASIIVSSSNITNSVDNEAHLAVRYASSSVSTYSNKSLSMCYFDDSYIDFSQESNRNLFVDQLGYPKDLQKQIDDGVIANPLIYLPFDDTSNLGTNNGTGGDFSVNGTVTAGADVNPS